MKRKYVKGDSVYEDFLGDASKPNKLWCKSCQQWIPPSHYQQGKPQYIHSCYDARALEIETSKSKIS